MVRTLLEDARVLEPGRGSIVRHDRQRHDTMIVDDGRGGRWFVKRRGPALVSGPLSLSRELSFHRWLAEGALPSVLRRQVPSLVAADDAHDVLVFAEIPDHVVLADALRDDTIDTDAVCARIGVAIAALHATRAEQAHPPLAVVDNPVQTHGRCTPELVAHGPRASFELLRLLQADPRLNPALRALRASWRRHALIHGDLKADNVVIARADGAGAEPMLVDWELAGAGEPAWDCGALFGSLCFQWLERMRPHTGIASPARVFAAFRAFWTAYERERLAADPTFDAEREVELAFRWAGYWLLQRVTILLPLRRSLTALDVSALHVAAYLVVEGTLAGAPLGAGAGD